MIFLAYIFSCNKIFLEKDSAAGILILILYGVVSNPVHLNIWIIIWKDVSVFHSGLMHANTQNYVLKFLLLFFKEQGKNGKAVQCRQSSYLTWAADIFGKNRQKIGCTSPSPSLKQKIRFSKRKRHICRLEKTPFTGRFKVHKTLGWKISLVFVRHFLQETGLGANGRKKQTNPSGWKSKLDKFKWEVRCS